MDPLLDTVPSLVSSASSESTSTTNTSTSTTATDWTFLHTWNDDSVAQVAAWWKLTDQDVAKLRQLGRNLQDMDAHPHNQPNQVVRYYRDAHGHIGRAEAKFRRMIAWRRQEGVDAIVDDYEPPHPLLREYLPTTVLNTTDRDGDPIWIERIGACDSWGLLQAFGAEALLKYAVWVRESCLTGPWARAYQQDSPSGKPPMRATAIIDLEGMGWDHLKPSLLPLLKEGLVIVQHYYCGFGKKVIVIRTSKLFPIVWKVAQHFCGENLRNMMVFATADNYLDVLEEYVALEDLPPCLYKGGKGRGGVGMPNNLEGGKVPSLNELDKMWEQRQQQYNNRSADLKLGGSSTTSGMTDDDHRMTHHDNNEPVSPVVKRLGGGSFDFVSASEGDGRVIVSDL